MTIRGVGCVGDIYGLLENDKIMVQEGNPTIFFTLFTSDPRKKESSLLMV
jgi:hypothetical protein